MYAQCEFAGLAGIKPERGLLVLSAALQAAADPISAWPVATSAGPIVWQNLLKAPGRRHALYDEFKVGPHQGEKICMTKQSSGVYVTLPLTSASDAASDAAQGSMLGQGTGSIILSVLQAGWGSTAESASPECGAGSSY